MSSDRWLDDLAMTLARGRSRRDALKVFTAAFTTALVGAFSTTRVDAQGRGCVEVCKERGHTGRDLGQCIEDCQRNGIGCGPVVCPEDEVCCNESCGMCTPPGGFCIDITCS